jgi:hypothetical protein
MTECPHCHQQAMSELAKACLGPARKRSCRSCGKCVSVSWFAMFELIPLFLGGLLTLWLLPSWHAVVPVLLGAAVMFPVHSRWVPLVPRGS